VDALLLEGPEQPRGQACGDPATVKDSVTGTSAARAARRAAHSAQPASRRWR
jgi:hypothetical protein